jgi:hypothetical protein
MSKVLLRFTYFLALFLAYSCSNPLDVSIDKSSYKLNEIRIDNLFNQSTLSGTVSEIKTYYSKIPEILEYQLYYCYKTGMPTDAGFDSSYMDIKSNPYFQRLEKGTSEKFKTLKQKTSTIENGLKRLNIHLPQAKLPENLVYMNSYFASSVYCTEKDIAIGLERYLGENNKVIKELPNETFYAWIKKAMDERYMERDAVCAWIMTHICEPQKDLNNISAFIQWGKILYLTKAAFPNVDESIILRYSDKSYQWAVTNERMVWEYLVKENLLFRKNETEQANFLQEAPFTAGLPQNSPDRMGQFMGYRIVCSYMEQYQLSLSELLTTPYNELLSEYEIND